MKQNKNKDLILASASPRRRIMMKKAGYSFQIKPSHIREVKPRHLKGGGLVVHLAKRKAVDISRKFPNAVVLGADTLVFINRQILGKPKSKSHAVRMLKSLSGRWQAVYSGVAVVWNGGRRIKTGFKRSDVKLRDLSDRDIQKAVRRHLDKAGAYAVQQKDDPFVEKMRGDYDNVVGLPMKLVRTLLRQVC